MPVTDTLVKLIEPAARGVVEKPPIEIPKSAAVEVVLPLTVTFVMASVPLNPPMLMSPSRLPVA